MQRLRRDAEPEVLGLEEARVDQGGLALALAARQPPSQRHQSDRAGAHQRTDRSSSVFPDEDPEHDPAHADRGEDRADDVHLPRAGVRDVVDEPHSEQDDPDDHELAKEADPPGEIGGDQAAEQGADGGGDRGRGADERVGLALHRSLEVAVNERLHRGQEERGSETADDRPADDDREEALGQSHRECAHRVAEQADDVGALAPDQVADLAADEDERRRDECLERDRRLHPARGRVEILDDRRDRDVHQRRVEDEDEHRHRQKHRELRPPACSLRHDGGRLHAHTRRVPPRGLLAHHPNWASARTASVPRNEPCACSRPPRSPRSCRALRRRVRWRRRRRLELDEPRARRRPHRPSRPPRRATGPTGSAVRSRTGRTRSSRSARACRATRPRTTCSPPATTSRTRTRRSRTT